MNDGLARNFLFLTAGSVLGPVFSMLLVLAISHLRGMEMLGQYSLVMTVFVVGQSCASLGLPVIVTREVARVREEAARYLVNASLVAAAVVAIALAVLLPAVWSLPADGDIRVAVSLTLLSLLPSAVIANGEAILLAFGRAEDSVGVALGENAARAGVGTALVLLGFGVVGIATVLLVLRAAASVVLVALLRRRGMALSAPFDRGICRRLLAELPVVGAIPIVNQLYARSDVFLLTWLGTWRDVGLYSAGLRLVDVARTVPAAYGRALYPVLSRTHAVGAAEFAEQTRRALRQVVILVTPMIVVLGGLAPLLVTGIFGRDAAGGEASLTILAWTLIPVGLACVLAQVLFAAGRQAVDLRTNVIATLASVAANAVLVPPLGALGAGVAMLGSMTLYAALQYWWVRTYELRPQMLGFVGRTTAVAVASVIVTLAALATHPLLGVALGATTYVAGSLLAGTLTRNDLGHVWQRTAAGRRWLFGER